MVNYQKDSGRPRNKALWFKVLSLGSMLVVGAACSSTSEPAPRRERRAEVPTQSAKDKKNAAKAGEKGAAGKCPVDHAAMKGKGKSGYDHSKHAKNPHGGDQAMGKCPLGHGPGGSASNKDWWPNQLDLRVLHQHSRLSNPMAEDFNYAEEFKKLDLKALKKDIAKIMKKSQDWWPADYGNYGPLFIRLAWHSAGTYRTRDGRGGASAGTIRFAPLNSFPDNANLDKARRLLWPVKKKYGRAISWADLMILTGNVALETMGFKTMGFAGGRADVWEPEADIDWGPEKAWLASQREKNGDLMHALAATEMGLIYVNPQGPGGKPDPLASAKNIRLTFGRMAMNDEETVALIAGGHTLGKAHGAAAAAKHVGREPEAGQIEDQGFGWNNSYGKGHSEHTITSGLEGAWTSTPDQWSHEYFENLYGYEWKLVKSPGGGWQWTPKDESAKGLVPDAHDPKKSHAPVMFTTDLALREDPIYKKISKRFLDNPKEFEKAFAKAWYKLTHRDLGPYARCLGAEVPAAQPWQDPVPAVDFKLVSDADVAMLKVKILGSGLSVSDLVSTAFASASSFRGSDKRGGANGARIRLEPQVSWDVNQPAQLKKVLAKLEKIQKDFNASKKDGTKISIADVIVLAGTAAVEKAAKDGGYAVSIPFKPGRTDASAEMTDVQSFNALEPQSDGFRNYHSKKSYYAAPEALIDRANLLTLTAPEMTVLIGGLRVLNTNFDGSKHGVFTDKPGTLSNDFFVNLLDMKYKWSKSKSSDGVYEGRDRKSGKVVWTGTAVDLVFGSNSQLRALAEVYASDDGKQKFANDFAKVWSKVMTLDRFDLDPSLKKKK